MLDNRSLEALAAVVEEGGFDKAAQHLNLTQSAVSQRIRNLEEQLGQVLVVRSSPPEPTAAGRKLIKHLRQVRLMEHELTDSLGMSNQDGFISLPLGVNADSLATWLLDALSEFLREKRVLLDIYVDDENQTHELLRRGEVAGCIGTGQKAIKGCLNQYLATVNYRCVCTPDFYAKWLHGGFSAQVAGVTPAAVFNRKDETQRQMLEKVFPDQKIKHPIFYVPSSEAFVEVVKHGLAYGMVPDIQIEDELASGELIEFLPQGKVEVPLYWQSWNVDTPLLKGMGTVLTEYFAGKN